MKLALVVVYAAQAVIVLGLCLGVLALARLCATKSPSEEMPPNRDWSADQVFDPDEDDDLLPREFRAGPGVFIDD